MSSLAHKTVVPIRPDLRAVERRVVDTDNGYTRIANELLEAVIGSGLTQNQLLITLAVIRKTYGYNKTADWVGNAQLSELTGLPETRCSTERNKLIKMCVLTASGRLVGINKEITSWQTKFNGISKTFTESVKFTEPVKETFTESVNPGLQNLLNTKDNIQKTKDNINKPPIVPQADKPKAFDPLTAELPNWLPRAVWSSWVCYRKELKKPIKSQQTVTQAVNLLERSLAKGYQPDEVINPSIANGWQGLFEPKQAKPSAKPQSAPGRAVSENFNGKNYGETQMPSWMEG